ncbi:hypothetical protein Agub_g12167, partial [Astrephomene gubernaculifera]
MALGLGKSPPGLGTLQLLFSLVILLQCAQCAQQRVHIVTGRSIAPIGGRASVYNGTRETSFSNQLVKTFPNGLTYWWNDSKGYMNFGDERYSGTFRYLLRFEDLHRYVPAGAVVQSAELVVTFLNVHYWVQVQACYMSKQWSAYELPAQRFTSTGWLYSRWNGSASLNWTEPGGWADCNRQANISFLAPYISGSGQAYYPITIPLDTKIVAGWIANKGAANYGMMFRGMNGSIFVMNAAWQNGTLFRPSLTITYDTAAGATAPTVKYPYNVTSVPRIWWVGPEGNDEAYSGQPELPFASPAKALIWAKPGDKIYMKTGSYGGSLSITQPNITLQSAPGHWAVISSPLNDPHGAVNTFTIFPGADNGVFQNFEITGGFYYAVMFYTAWGTYRTTQQNVANGTAPSNWVLQNMRIHDTGSSCVKLSVNSRNNSFSNCEIYNAGTRFRTYGFGIEAVQAYDLDISDCYFHDTAGGAVLLAGGTARASLKRNYMEQVNSGIEVGGFTGADMFNTLDNPNLYEAINTTLRNNIITATRLAGIVLRGALRTSVTHNTLWRVMEGGQAGILLDASVHGITGRGNVYLGNRDVTLWGNIVARSASAAAGPLLQIRASGLDTVSPNLTTGYNVYHDQAAQAATNGTFKWGVGVMLEDQRAGSLFVGNLSGWRQFCTAKLNLTMCEVNSTEADPRLNATFTPLPCSPAKGRVPMTIPGDIPPNNNDFHSRKRPVGLYDAGAVQSGAAGAVKAIPPVPDAFKAYAAFKGMGRPSTFDFGWPYYFWQSRICKNLTVDAIYGNDSQPFDYYANYAQPFRTIQAALDHGSNCDRIFLRAGPGQRHPGYITFMKATNTSITTHPADLPARATIVCSQNVTTPCIYMYFSATAINITGLDIAMSNGSSGSCMHLDGPGGSGTSPYWNWYAGTSGKFSPLLSFFTDMNLTNCGTHGIKLSTFVYGVVMERLNISGPGLVGINVVGGGNLTIRANNILNPGEAGIRLGGGVRNTRVDRNYIKNFGGVGIMLGSEGTDVSNMDVDWAKYGYSTPSWHDCFNTTVINNILDGGAGAGIAFYGARDAVVVHNTILGVAGTMQAGVLLNVSPKQIGPASEVGPPNTNITFKNNIVTLPPGTFLRFVVQARILQGSLVNLKLNISRPTGTCTAARRQLRGMTQVWQEDPLAPAATAAPGSRAVRSELVVEETGAVVRRRSLLPLSFTDPYTKATGVQGRNADGSCPVFPDSSPWHQDVSGLSVHPRSEAIKSNIGPNKGLHFDFGFEVSYLGTKFPAGKPINIIDSRNITTRIKVVPGPTGYFDPTENNPNGFPFPADLKIQNAFPGCGDPPCWGDRHMIVVDNATCTLYESYRTFPPSVTKNGTWQIDYLCHFNLSRAAIERPMGATSADAAGLAILPGLVRYEEIVRGYIDHALRFTGPCSRPAYALPATHFASVGYNGTDAPYMGMRVRLKANYNCTKLARAARIFCEALKKYGGIYADNGAVWDFDGEATEKWYPLWSELTDIYKINSTELEVIDPGCICTNGGCTIAECHGLAWVDPNSPLVFPAIDNSSNIVFANNFYYKPNTTGLYID